MAYSNLKAEMSRFEVSVEDLARTAKVTRQTVYNWFRGKSAPTIEQAKDIQDEFFDSCELRYLFSSG